MSSTATSSSVARFGHLDMRAQAEVPSARRTDTPPLETVQEGLYDDRGELKETFTTVLAVR